MEAHDGDLRGLALTADGSKLATASVKGTVIRVWDVSTSTCLQEFRRGVERTTITCLSWSWDSEYLCSTSDKGTAHIFQMGNPTKSATEKTSASLTQMLYSSVRKSVEGDAKKSICQIRGVPHPQACAFVADATNLIAVAGWDADGNGVLLLAEFAVGEEAKRVGYHVLCKAAVQDESEEARRRRRLRGATYPTEEFKTPEGGRLYVGERLELLEKGMEQIHFEEKDEFVSVTAIRTEETVADQEGEQTAANKTNDDSAEARIGGDSSHNTDELAQSNIYRDSGTVGDSVRTEPLDDDADPSGSQ
jgi:hypothetical protein